MTREKPTVGASLYTAYPAFRDILPQIINTLLAAGGAYSPEVAVFDEAGKLRRIPFQPSLIDTLSAIWKKRSANMIILNRRSPVQIETRITSAASSFIGMSIESDYLKGSNTSRELLELMKKIHNTLFAFYGNASVPETVTWYE